MAVTRTYKCPECAGSFDFRHIPSDEPPPRFCPLCGYDSQETVPESGAKEALVIPRIPFKNQPTAPHIASERAKATENYIKAMDEGDKFRVDHARANGMDAADANAMRTTNMKDNLRAGDTTFVPVVNDVSRAIEAQPGRLGFVGQQTEALEASAHVRQGPFPNMGARMQKALRHQHSASMAGSGHKGAVSSELPALETTMPGYRGRV